MRMAGVMPVMSDPPEPPILAGKDTEKGEHELEQLAGLERMMGEQSMIARGDPEDLQRAGDQECGYRRAAPADEKNQSAAQMHHYKRCHECNVPRRQQSHLVGLGFHL